MDTDNQDTSTEEHPEQDTTADAPATAPEPDQPAENETSEPVSQDTTEPPQNEQLVRIVAIKFRDAGKLYDFDSRGFELERGTQVVVETDRGRALGTVVLEPRETPREKTPDGLKNVLRIANEKDLESARRHAEREHDALRFCRQRAAERNMEMKLVKAEYLFDGSKIIFYFTADGRVDFRELVKDLAHHFHTRIEMRQIGVRDEAKLIGGIGVCGRELCCCSFLREFDPVSVKMAKEQGLALNPSKISGQCGRLLCCLGYEFETYCSLKKGLPKCGRKVKLGDETVEVAQIDILRQQVTIRREDAQTDVVSADEIRQGTVQSPQPGSGKPRNEKLDKPRDTRKERPKRQSEEKSEQPAEKEQAASPPEHKKDQQHQVQDGERKKRRRPRRRRRGKRGGQDKNQGPTSTDNT